MICTPSIRYCSRSASGRPRWSTEARTTSPMPSSAMISARVLIEVSALSRFRNVPVRGLAFSRFWKAPVRGLNCPASSSPSIGSVSSSIDTTSFASGPSPITSTLIDGSRKAERWGSASLSPSDRPNDKPSVASRSPLEIGTTFRKSEMPANATPTTTYTKSSRPMVAPTVARCLSYKAKVCIRLSVVATYTTRVVRWRTGPWRKSSLTSRKAPISSSSSSSRTTSPRTEMKWLRTWTMCSGPRRARCRHGAAADRNSFMEAGFAELDGRAVIRCPILGRQRSPRIAVIHIRITSRQLPHAPVDSRTLLRRSACSLPGTCLALPVINCTASALALC